MAKDEEFRFFNNLGEEILGVGKNLQSLLQYLADHGFLTINTHQTLDPGLICIDFDFDSWREICEAAVSLNSQEFLWFIGERCTLNLWFLFDDQPNNNSEMLCEKSEPVWIVSVQVSKEDISHLDQLIRLTFENRIRRGSYSIH
jgi:hypothetical protein